MQQSLVKYESPVLLSKTTDKKSTRARPAKNSNNNTLNGTQLVGVTGAPPVPSPVSKLPPVEQKKLQATEDILNSILPPREWSEAQQLWVQQVSSTPATRLDVTCLQETLDQKLTQRQARETGICPVRRELYSQAFDEIIRQVTIECSERGLLLLRIRDEIRMTIAAYQTLYESSVAFGIRKALMAEQGKADQEARVAQLEVEKKELEIQVNGLKSICDEMERKEAERRVVDERKHAEELHFLKRTNTQLKTQLESILAPTKGK